VPILAAAAALAVAIVLVLMASARPNAGGVDATQNAGDATRTGTAGAASVAVPTVAGPIEVEGTPNYVQVAPNGKFAYIANPGAGVIDVLNTADDRVSGTIKIPQGPPQSVSFSPDSRTAYVSVYNGSNTVHLIAFIDTATGAVSPSTVSVNNHEPGPSATSPDGLYLYVPNHDMTQGGAGDNVLDVIDLASKKVIDSIQVEPNPHWVVFGKNGVFYVTDHMSAFVTVLNANTNGIITKIPVGETPHSAALSPDGSRLAVTSYSGNEVFLVNTATDKWVATSSRQTTIATRSR
jgi:serine/threonine-protein kinase